MTADHCVRYESTLDVIVVCIATPTPILQLDAQKAIV